MVEAVSSLALQAGTTVDGSPVLTEASSIGSSQLDGTAGTTGQVLTTDGATVTWSDTSGGNGELTSPASLGASDGGDDFSSLDTPLTIPDNNSVGITSVRYISDILTVDTLSIDLQMTHDELGELSVTLTSPSGTTLTIYDGGNPGETSFDDNIGWNVDFNSGNLYSYNGESTQGTWMLNVVDVTNGNAGTLDSWNLRFNENWDGEMFIGGGLTVQSATEIRDDLTILDSDLVMTDQYGNEEFRIGSDTGTALYKMDKGCVLNQTVNSTAQYNSVEASGLLTLDATCNTARCRKLNSSIWYYFTCGGGCGALSGQTCNNTQVGNIILYQ
jgi:subtilisin-like proprotein convertase family protein